MGVSPCELVNMISVITCAIANCIEDEDEIEVLAAVFTTLGDSLATYVTYKQACCAKASNETEVPADDVLS